MPQVDVIPDGFDWWNAIVGTAGVLIALVAIVIALSANKKADRAVVTERRRVFELEILRDLSEDLDMGLARKLVKENHRELRRYRLRLNLLSTRLESWDAVIAADSFAGVMAAGGVPEFEANERELAAAKDSDRRDARKRILELENRQRVLMAEAPGVLKRRLAWDVEQAVLARVEARPVRERPWWRRLGRRVLDLLG